MLCCGVVGCGVFSSTSPPARVVRRERGTTKEKEKEKEREDSASPAAAVVSKKRKKRSTSRDRSESVCLFQIVELFFFFRSFAVV